LIFLRFQARFSNDLEIDMKTIAIASKEGLYAPPFQGGASSQKLKGKSQKGNFYFLLLPFDFQGADIPHLVVTLIS